ncbi:MAG: hypothetical protein M0Z47_11635 [Actinomycetota bacterium]|nr:hypothetical protein [Actinomycetota bacterium]
MSLLPVQANVAPLPRTALGVIEDHLPVVVRKTDEFPPSRAGQLISGRHEEPPNSATEVPIVTGVELKTGTPSGGVGPVLHRDDPGRHRSAWTWAEISPQPTPQDRDIWRVTHT